MARRRYWAHVGVNGIVTAVHVADLGWAESHRSNLSSDELLIECRKTDDWQDQCSIGYSYDEESGLFIPPSPEFDDPDKFFDREQWKWRCPILEAAKAELGNTPTDSP